MIILDKMLGRPIIYMDVVSYFIDKFNFLWIKDIFVFVTFIWYRELMPYQIIRNLKTWC